MKLENVDFLSVAAGSTSLARECPVDEFSLSEAIAVARKCALHFQQASGQSLEVLFDEGEATALIAAARILSSVGAHLKNHPNVEQYGEGDELLLSSAIMFSMYGNFPSAHAVLERISFDYILEMDERIVAAVVADPRMIGRFLRANFRFQETRSLLVRWEQFLMTGKDEIFDEVTKAFERLMLTNSIAEAALLRNARIAMRQVYGLSTVRCLMHAETAVPQELIEGLLKTGVVTLLPPQRKLLYEKRIASDAENVLLNLPTSTGKSLIAECCVTASFRGQPGLAVIVVPYVAIGNQFVAALRSHLRHSSFHVRSMFGGYKLDKGIDPGSRKEILVTTPERFDAWIRANGIGDELKIIVFDEIGRASCRERV